MLGSRCLIRKGNEYGVGGTVITTLHARVKKALGKVLFDQVRLVIDQLKDIDRAAEGAHRCAHAGLLVDPEGRLSPFMLYIAFCDIGEGVPQFHFLVFMDLPPLLSFMLLPSTSVVAIHRSSTVGANVKFFELVQIFKDGGYKGGVAPCQGRDGERLIREGVNLLCQDTRR